MSIEVKLAPVTTVTPRKSSGRSLEKLHADWFFQRSDQVDEQKWEEVCIPHTVRLEPLNASGGRNFQGLCWYRRTLHWSGEKGRIVYLKFDGAMQVSDIWLNGRKIDTHFGGYTPFVYDITQQLKPGSNTLLLRLDNRDNPDVPPGKPQGELDFVYFGGLYRNVWLETTDELHISDEIHANRVAGGGVFVTYPSVTKEHATVHVQVDLRNAGPRSVDGQIIVELLDTNANLVANIVGEVHVPFSESATWEKTLEVRQPRLWHPDHPYLYTLLIRVEKAGEQVDEIRRRIGIRKIEFAADQGLLINGDKYLSIGANRHQDHPYVGYALSDAAQWRDAVKLKEAGFTSYRSHYPQAPAFMDACDALGILAIVSNPGWQFVGGEEFKKQALHNARLMVRRDRNRPCVVLWEAALNESDNRALAEGLCRAVHEEYPAQGCYVAGDRTTHFGGPDVKSQEEPSAWDVDYLHNDGTKPYWVREWGDAVDNWSDQQSANRVSRGWGEVPMLTQARAHLTRFDELFDAHMGTKTHGGKRLAGACLWAGIDCQRGYHHQPFYGGPMDAFRLPKFDYYLFRTQRPPTAIHGGPVVFIANFATFLSPTTVTVFSNCEQVRLIHGSREVGIRQPDTGHHVPHPPFTFSVGEFSEEKTTMYMTGVTGPENSPVELIAEGLIGGNVVTRHVIRPPGVAKQLILEVDTCGIPLVADGADFVRVHARVCDARGTVCPTADDDVTFKVSGEASVVEAPSANPMRAEAGIATALIRSSNKAGKIRVRASAFGLAAAEAEITSLMDTTRLR